jgi:hypothetical protein
LLEIIDEEAGEEDEAESSEESEVELDVDPALGTDQY